MGKMSELAAELAELKRCGEVLIGISETLTEIFSGAGGEPAAKEEKPGKKRETCRRNRSYLGGGLSNSAVEFRCEAVFTPSIIQIAAMVTVKIKEEQVYGRIEYCDCR